MTDDPGANSLLDVEVQKALDSAESDEPPSLTSLCVWAQTAYAAVVATRAEYNTPAEVTIRLVECDEMRALNKDYRNQDKATNVLSFPLKLEERMRVEMAINPLGDVVICHPIILQEALQQGKSNTDHYAHMVTHGTLHLCGYDHQNDEQAEQMESLEIQILAQSNIANPYL